MSAIPSTPDGAASDLYCPISLSLMSDPVVAADGCSYDRVCIQTWFSMCKEEKIAVTSPMKGSAMTEALTPNPALRERVEAWRAVAGEGRMQLETLNSRFFADLDKFQSSKLMVNLQLRAASIVALGNENVGKSTLLERIIGFPVLPRAKGTCTRLALRIQLRRGPSKMSKVSLWTRGATKTLVAGTEAYAALAKLAEKVQALMDKAVADAGTPIVKHQEILIEIQVDYCPNLNIVDIPGVVLTAAGQPNPTKELALSVIEEEKNSATFLLVVPATGVGQDSIATLLVEELKLLDSTIGVYTNLDMIVPIDDDHTRASTLKALIQGTGPGCRPLKHGWMGCSNRGPGLKALEAVPGCKEVFRLQNIQDQEKALIAAVLQEAVATGCDMGEVTGRLGITAVRQFVQKFFEQYLTGKWMPSIQTTLRKEFDDRAHENFYCGVPIPNDVAYTPVLESLRKLVAAGALPGFPTDHLDVKSNVVFKSILQLRVRATIQHKSKDWPKLVSNAEIWTLKNSLTTRIPATEKTWAATPKIFYLDALKMASDESAAIVDVANKIVALLVRMKVTPLLIEALFAPPPEKPPVGMFQKMTNFFKAKEFDKQDDNVQASIARLDYYPGLKAQLQTYFQTCEAAQQQAFQVKANAIIAEFTDCVDVTYEPAASVMGVLSFRKRDVLMKLGDTLLTAWFRTVVVPIEERTAAWDVPACAMNETCKAQRLAALNGMLDAATALDALRQLKEKVDRGAAP